MNRQRHGGLLTGLLVIAATAPKASPAEGGEIRIWPTAVVTGDVVTLADVADLGGLDFSTRRQLAGVAVHSAPRAGAEVLVRIGDIRKALAEAEANMASVTILGSSRCKVSKPRPPREPRAEPRRPARRRPKAAPPRRSEPRRAEPRPRTLRSVLREYVEARVADPDARLEIRFSPTAAEVLQLSADEHRFKIHRANERKVGFLGFEVDIVPRAGGPARREPIVAEVQLVKEVVVARRAINRGKTIEARDLRLQERRFSDLESVGITDLAAAVGRRSARFLRKGDMLQAEWLQAEPVVQRGEIVTIWVRSGGVEVKTTGKAQRSGGLGETIEVRPEGARRKQDLIEAVVTGPGTVSVQDARRLAGG